MQRRTDDAVEAVRLRGEPLSPQQFGTAVHTNLKRQIEALRDPDFLAEVSILKAIEDGYGLPGSIRIDVLENVDGRTVCVYDIKTGRSGLSSARSMEIVEKVYGAFPSANRIVVTEIRPQR